MSQCSAYLVLVEDSFDGFQLKVPCSLFDRHAGRHVAGPFLEDYCRTDTDHRPVLTWEGDDRPAVEAREVVFQEQCRRMAQEREAALAALRARQRAWQGSEEAREEFIKQASRFLNMAPTLIAPWVEQCPCDQRECTGWRFKKGALSESTD
jgi:hypothetical protein